MTAGERMRAARKEQGMRAVTPADAIGVSKQTLYKYEHGIVINIPLDKVEAAGRALGISPAALLGWDTGMTAAERQLLECYRALGGEDRAMLLGYARDLAEEQAARKGTGCGSAVPGPVY